MIKQPVKTFVSFCACFNASKREKIKTWCSPTKTHTISMPHPIGWIHQMAQAHHAHSMCMGLWFWWTKIRASCHKSWYYSVNVYCKRSICCTLSQKALLPLLVYLFQKLAFWSSTAETVPLSVVNFFSVLQIYELLDCFCIQVHSGSLE
jgi:hypothetical protein